MYDSVVVQMTIACLSYYWFKMVVPEGCYEIASRSFLCLRPTVCVGASAFQYAESSSRLSCILALNLRVRGFFVRM